MGAVLVLSIILLSHYPIIPLPHYLIILLSYYSISLSILYGFPAAFAARIAGSIQTVDYGDAEFGFAR